MKPKFHKKVLKNGMTLIFEKRDIPVVSLAFVVRNGGINESEQEKGVSHFIEHMLYKGTPTRNTLGIASEIEKNGGELNGFTDDEAVAYWCKVPSKHLKIALDVLSDMIKNPLFDQKEIDKERNVILEEIKMNHDNPILHCFKKIQANLYKGDFGKMRIGTKETLIKMNRGFLVSKFEEIYNPDNMILAVVGDADFNELVEFLEDNFGEGKSRNQEVKIELVNTSSEEKRKGLDQAHCIFAYHVPVTGKKESYAARVLSTLLAGGMSSRLFSEIREKRNLAYAIKGDSNIGKRFAFNCIYVGTTKENLELVQKLIVEEFSKLKEDLTEKELEEIKNQLVGNYHISMEDSQLQMLGLLYNEIEEKAENFYEFEKNILSVKLEEVKKLAEEVVKGKYSVFSLVPEK